MRPPKMTTRPVYLRLSRLLPGVDACFDLVGTSERLSYTDHMRCMVRDHMRIKHEGRMECWSGFPLHGVHQFESPRLSDMSNYLFLAVTT
jgi:hypothetical protein